MKRSKRTKKAQTHERVVWLLREKTQEKGPNAIYSCIHRCIILRTCTSHQKSCPVFEFKGAEKKHILLRRSIYSSLMFCFGFLVLHFYKIILRNESFVCLSLFLPKHIINLNIFKQEFPYTEDWIMHDYTEKMHILFCSFFILFGVCYYFNQFKILYHYISPFFFLFCMQNLFSVLKSYIYIYIYISMNGPKMLFSE